MKNKNLKETRSKAMKKVALKNWEDPEYRAKQLADRKTRKDNPEFLEKMREINIEKFQDENIKKKISAKQKRNFKNPERKEKHHQMLEDTMEQRSEKMKNNWNNPFFVYRVMKSRLNPSKALETIEKRFGIGTRIECEEILEKRRKKNG